MCSIKVDCQNSSDSVDIHLLRVHHHSEQCVWKIDQFSNFISTCLSGIKNSDQQNKMMRLVNIVLLFVLFSCGFAVVTAHNSTFIEETTNLWTQSRSLVEDARRRGKFPFAKHVWCKLT
jgi:hypothetical protein